MSTTRKSYATRRLTAGICPVVCGSPLLFAAWVLQHRDGIQTGSNGAVLSFSRDFGIAAPEEPPDWEREQWLVGLISAIPYVAAALLEVWLTKLCNDALGRRGCIFVSGILLVVSSLVSAFTHSWQSLRGVLVLMGVGMGLKGSTAPIFAAEHAPTRVRAGLTATWQLAVAAGLLLGFSAKAVFAKTGRIA